MPRRLIRGGILTSERINQLDVHGERFYFRLLLVIDDFGRFSADSRILRSSIFPLKDDIRTADILRLVTACEKAGLIRLYKVGEKEYLEVQDFRQTIRAKVSKYPQPDPKCGADESQTRGKCGAHVPGDEDGDEDGGGGGNPAHGARPPHPPINHYPQSVDEVMAIARDPRCGMPTTREQAEAYFLSRDTADWFDAMRRKIQPGKVYGDLKRWLLRDKDDASRKEKTDAGYRSVGF